MNSEEIFRAFKSETLPRFLQFETSTVCNASCKMCPHGEMTPRREMKWSEINQIIRDIVPYVDMVCPFLMQEPTMDKRLVQILTNIKSKNPLVTTSVYSNMAGFTPEVTDKILDRGVLDELHISFYAPTP
jgi:MoaA/NifB/PqqE/SkfB family radical SAM enzyme